MIFTIEMRSTRWEDLGQEQFNDLEAALNFFFGGGPHSTIASSIVTEIDGERCFLTGTWNAKTERKAKFYAYSTIQNATVEDVPFIAPHATFEAKDKTWTRTH